METVDIIEYVVKIGALLGVGTILGTVVSNYQTRKKRSAETENIEKDGIVKTNDEWENLYKNLRDQAEVLSREFDTLNEKYLKLLHNYREAEAARMTLELKIKEQEEHIQELLRNAS